MEQGRTKYGEYAARITNDDVRTALGDHPQPVATTHDLADTLGVSRDTVRRRLGEMSERGEVERKKVGARAVVWWIPQSAIDAEVRLKRLSNDLAEPITVGDRVYEDGDRHALDPADDDTHGNGDP